jgi:F-type H+-transporting ATPase subunit epsilon
MQIEVVTPAGIAVTTDAEELTAPGVRGEFGILPGHTPFISALRAGVLSWKTKGKRGVLAVGPGYAEISGKDRVVVLTQSAASSEQIDVGQAQKDLEEAERLLKDWKAAELGSVGPTREELDARRAWAQARLDAKKS